MPENFMELLHSHEAEGEAYWFDKGLRIIRSRAGKHGISFVEHLMPKDFLSPLHIHHEDNDVMYLLDGEVFFYCGGDTFVAHGGDFVSLPPGVPHSFRVLSETCSAIGIYKDDYFANLVTALGEKATSLTLPPEEHNRQIDDSDMERVIEEFAKRGVKFDNDVEILGPPPQELFQSAP